ncbi:MAG: sigma-70 family RNA polymerase sigma factor [Thermoanaerobaculia bacterium]|nr:sigma-70 family RNA polymerase sigma factor [Thermoanaerobaculia bacterium]
MKNILLQDLATDTTLVASVVASVAATAERVTASRDEQDRDLEIALVARVQAGDLNAFGRLVERHMRRAQRVAAGLVGNVEDGFDLSQDAFVRAFRARHSLDPRRPFYPWYYQILRRLCFNFLRDRGRLLERQEQATPWLVNDADRRAGRWRPDCEAETRELRRRLGAAIQALPDHEKETFVLREFDDLRYREIAEWLDIPVGTVMSRLYAARRRLAAMLDESGETS